MNMHTVTHTMTTIISVLDAPDQGVFIFEIPLRIA